MTVGQHQKGGKHNFHNGQEKTDNAFECFDPCGPDNGLLTMAFLGIKKMSISLQKYHLICRAGSLKPRNQTWKSTTESQNLSPSFHNEASS